MPTLETELAGDSGFLALASESGAAHLLPGRDGPDLVRSVPAGEEKRDRRPQLHNLEQPNLSAVDLDQRTAILPVERRADLVAPGTVERTSAPSSLAKLRGVSSTAPTSRHTGNRVTTELSRPATRLP
ncbi:hypothetical protein [Nocardia carnea]|uniref:Uncharacterized protein n=1 Tax=Nocardia carnea TaxID=37328 RepID=A0ABW7TXZ8_9NOCA|nr:hypothetical protein [Nocardia carnea]